LKGAADQEGLFRMFKDANLERFLYSSETDNVPMRQSGRG
jgi:hypothetical protein